MYKEEGEMERNERELVHENTFLFFIINIYRYIDIYFYTILKNVSHWCLEFLKN